MPVTDENTLYTYNKIFYVSVPSRIKSVSSGGNIDTKKDSLIKLNCEADGNPVPNITWTRKVNGVGFVRFHRDILNNETDFLFIFFFIQILKY